MKLLTDEGAVAEELPFKYDEKSSTFTPISTQVRWVGVKWLEAATLQLTVNIKYVVADKGGGFWGVVRPSPLIGKGSYTILQSWNLQYQDNGIVLQSEEVNWDGNGEGELAIALNGAASQSTSGGVANAVFVVQTTYGRNEDGIKVGYKGVSIPITEPSIRSARKDYKFKIFLRLVDRPQKAVALPEGYMKFIVRFEVEDQPAISTKEGDRLEDEWVTPLFNASKQLALAIKEGACLLKITGFASVTGPEAHNILLSAQRAASVGQALKRRFDKLIYVPVPRGSAQATQPGKSDQERRVEIEIDRPTAEKILGE
jgi:hypothetical protein